MRTYAAALPWFLPGLIVVIAVGLVFAARVGRAVGTGPRLGWLLVIGVGIVLAATVTPDSSGLDIGRPGRGCDLRRLWPASPLQYVRVGDIALNAILFVPLGIAVGLLPPSRASRMVAVGAFAFPFVIEGAQLVIPMLGRGCQSADVVDNVLGLAIGIGIAWLVRRGRAMPIRDQSD